MARIRTIGPLTSTLTLGKSQIFSGGRWRDDLGSTYITRTEMYESCHDEVHPGPPYLVGGPLAITKYRSEVQGCPVSNLRLTSVGGARYNGLVVPVNGPVIASPKMYDGSEYGAEAWDKMRPGKPGIDLAQSIAELKDMPGMIKSLRDLFGKAAKRPRDYGSAYLTGAFGIAPIINDLRNLHKTYVNQENILNQLIRDNGRRVRRKAKLLSVNTSTTTESVILSAEGWSTPPFVHPAPGTLTKVRTTSRNVWSEGAFRYYIPDIGSVKWRRRALINLYGLKPNVKLLWELTPWSWLIDWYVDVGAVLGNLSNDLAENLVADYAFIMAHTSSREDWIYAQNGLSEPGGQGISIVCSRSSVAETKSRVPASRFGFGLKSDDFSGRQIAILAALGLSRT